AAFLIQWRPGSETEAVVEPVGKAVILPAVQLFLFPVTPGFAVRRRLPIIARLVVTDIVRRVVAVNTMRLERIDLGSPLEGIIPLVVGPGGCTESPGQDQGSQGNRNCAFHSKSSSYSFLLCSALVLFLVFVLNPVFGCTFIL